MMPPVARRLLVAVLPLALPGLAAVLGLRRGGGGVHGLLVSPSPSRARARPMPTRALWPMPPLRPAAARAAAAAALSGAAPGGGGGDGIGAGDDGDAPPAIAETPPPVERLALEAREALECLAIAASAILFPPPPPGAGGAAEGAAEAVLRACDDLDEVVSGDRGGDGDDPRLGLFVNRQLGLRRRALELRRYSCLCRLLELDRAAYASAASLLSPSRIPRSQLPNVQDVPVEGASAAGTPPADSTTGYAPLVPDCELEPVRYEDSPLDALLLGVFRKLVERNTGGIRSEKAGIAGLLEQGRAFMLLPGQTPEAQHAMVRRTLGGLMTPPPPPLYRVFMSGIVPQVGSPWDGRRVGPWLYAPWLTSVVTPPFFKFLVGPSRPNRRIDGQRGGLLVEKCKFLQESGCKGLCLHQCKLPAEQFFARELGMPLTVSPNFATQECQWSFGLGPAAPADDPSFPPGCLAGCESRKLLLLTGASSPPASSPPEAGGPTRRAQGDLCSY
jgi:hypothetical protein